MKQIKIRKAYLIFVLFFLLGISRVCAQSNYSAPTKSVQISFLYGNIEQTGIPSLKSDIGFSFSTYHSYWLYKTNSHRFQLGIDVAWFDANYYNYKINRRNFEGSTSRYMMHQADLGLDLGAGINYSITQDLRLHGRICYNPAYSFIYQNETFQGAFANYGVLGLALSWKFIGIGIEGRFGGAKYNDIVIYEDLFESKERTNTKLTSLQTSLVFNF